MPPLGGAKLSTVFVTFVAPVASGEVEVVEEMDVVGAGAGGEARGDSEVVIIWLPAALSTGEIELLL